MAVKFDFTDVPAHSEIRNAASRFAAERIAPQAAEHDQAQEFNHGLFAEAAGLGFLGAIVPEKYGGAGLDSLAMVIIAEEMARKDPGFTLSALTHAVLCGYNLYVNGNDGQKQRYLPGIIQGKKRGGMAITEPDGGTDVLAMRARAERKGDYYILTGSKQFITNCDGDVFLVYARTGNNKRDISMFIVESGFEGFQMPKEEKNKHGMRASPTGTLYFDGCKVPVENLVGEENKGLIGMMRNLEIERVGLAAMGVGIALECFDMMHKYAGERESFGAPIYKHQGIGFVIAKDYAMLEAVGCLVYRAAAHISPGSNQRLLADSAKVAAAELAFNVAHHALQVLGGLGYCEGAVERLARDARLLSIGGGTTESHYKNIVKELYRR